MMMASKSMKVLNIIAGVLLIVAGIYCLCNQDIAAMTAGVMVGIFMLLSGVIVKDTKRFIDDLDGWDNTVVPVVGDKGNEINIPVDTTLVK